MHYSRRTLHQYDVGCTCGNDSLWRIQIQNASHSYTGSTYGTSMNNGQCSSFAPNHCVSSSPIAFVLVERSRTNEYMPLFQSHAVVCAHRLEHARNRSQCIKFFGNFFNPSTTDTMEAGDNVKMKQRHELIVS